MRESFPRQIDKKSRGPQGERGLEFSKRKKGQIFFSPLDSLGVYNNNVSCLRTVSGLKLLANPIILKCKLWESVWWGLSVQFNQFSHSVLSNSLQPHELQHAKPPCPSPTSGVHSNSHPSSQWCHPAIASSVVPFSSCPQSLPASESFPMSQLFAWGGQSTGVSALASFLPKKSQGWSPSEWTGWISLQSKGLSILLQHHSSKASILQHSAFFTVQLSHPYMITGKNHSLD